MDYFSGFMNSRNRARLAMPVIFLAVLLAIAHSIPSDKVICFAGQSAPSAPAGSPDKQASAIPALSHGDLYALVVGVSRFKNAAVPGLHGAANDARAFAKFLETQKDLYKDVRIELLTDEQAIKANLDNYLGHEIRKAGKNDTILLFFSGHGAVDPKHPGQFFFITHDGDPESLESTSVNMSGLAFLKDLECPRVMLIADACHSGGFSEWKTKSTLSPMKAFVRNFASSTGKVVITSSRPDEYSLESRYRESSVFTHWFLEGLKGAADKEGRGMVTVNEAYAYAYRQTKVETNGAQHPQFQSTVEGAFPLSITANLQGRIPTMLELTTAPSGAEVLVGGLFKGGSNNDGSFCLKYLPVGRPIPVLIRKAGWVKQDISPPVEFSEQKVHVTVPPVTLPTATASLEIKSTPGDVAVKIDGQPVGQTNGKGKLTLEGVQVAVNHLIELEKQGFERQPINLSIPVAYEGKKAQLEQVRLSKVSTERAVDRIQKDYTSEAKGKGGLKLRDKPIEGVTAQEMTFLEQNPLADKWEMESARVQHRARSIGGTARSDLYKALLDAEVERNANRGLPVEGGRDNVGE